MEKEDIFDFTGVSSEAKKIITPDSTTEKSPWGTERTESLVGIHTVSGRRSPARIGISTERKLPAKSLSFGGAQTTLKPPRTTPIKETSSYKESDFMGLEFSTDKERERSKQLPKSSFSWFDQHKNREAEEMDTKLPSSQLSNKSYPEPDEASMEEDDNISQLKWWLGIKLHVTRQDIAKLPTEMIMDLEDFSVLDESLLREVGISPLQQRKSHGCLLI